MRGGLGVGGLGVVPPGAGHGGTNAGRLSTVVSNMTQSQRMSRALGSLLPGMGSSMGGMGTVTNQRLSTINGFVGGSGKGGKAFGGSGVGLMALGGALGAGGKVVRSSILGGPGVGTGGYGPGGSMVGALHLSPMKRPGGSRILGSVGSIGGPFDSAPAPIQLSISQMETLFPDQFDGFLLDYQRYVVQKKQRIYRRRQIIGFAIESLLWKMRCVV
jgi:hypothetical protein